MHRLYFLLSILTVAALLAGCASKAAAQPEEIRALESPTQTGAQDVTTTVPVASALPEVLPDEPPSSCPTTRAPEVPFVAPDPYPAAPPERYAGEFWYGTEGLWTTLHTDGVWSRLSKTPDGYIQKIVWWSDLYSLKDEQQPALVVSGKRLDAKSDPLRFYGATNIIEEEAGEAMLTGVEFPTLGCWELRGEYKKSGLIFVVWIAP